MIYNLEDVIKPDKKTYYDFSDKLDYLEPRRCFKCKNSYPKGELYDKKGILLCGYCYTRITPNELMSLRG